MPTSPTHLIATAFTFGSAALVFAYLPFLFVLTRGIYKANNGHNAHSSSVVSVFLMAFFVHFLSCIGFLVVIKLLDTLSALQAPNYFQDKIFGIFWTAGKSAVFNAAGASGSIEDEGAFLQLYMVQTVADYLELFGIWVVLIAASSYALVQTKKDTMQFNLVGFLVWLIITNIVAIFSYFLWAKIASFALFLPSGDLISRIFNAYRNLVTW